MLREMLELSDARSYCRFRVSDLPATLITDHRIFLDQQSVAIPLFLPLRIVVVDLRHHDYVVGAESGRLEDACEPWHGN